MAQIKIEIFNNRLSGEQSLPVVRAKTQNPVGYDRLDSLLIQFGRRRYNVELIYLMLSVLLRFSPFVRPWADNPVLRFKGIRGHVSRVSLWLPAFGWVVVAVQRSAAIHWLPLRVVAVVSQDPTTRQREPKRRRGSQTMNGDRVLPLRDASPDIPASIANKRRSV